MLEGRHRKVAKIGIVTISLFHLSRHHPIHKFKKEKVLLILRIKFDTLYANNDIDKFKDWTWKQKKPKTTPTALTSLQENGKDNNQFDESHMAMNTWRIFAEETDLS